MKIKLGSITAVKFRASFEKLVKQESNKIPPKTMFKIRGINKIVAEETAKYDEIQATCLRQCAQKDENGDIKTQKVGSQVVVLLDKDKADEYNTKLNELGSIEVDIPELVFSELGDPEKLTLTSEDVISLVFIVE